MRYDMHLNEAPFNSIVAGNKTLEVRLNDSKRQLLQIGDEILFTNRNNENQTVLKTIKSLRKYDSFKDFAINEDCTMAGFDANYNTQDVVDAYRKYYSQEDENKFGVLVIEIF